MEFPFNTAVLWDRKGYGSPKFLKCAEKIAFIAFLPEDVRLLQKACRSNSAGVELTVHLFHKKLLKERNYLTTFGLHSLGVAKYCFLRLNNPISNSCVTVTIPVSIIDPQIKNAANPSGINRALMQNLSKSIASGRGFSLKQFMRIMASSTASKALSDPEYSADCEGDIRFEAVVPSLSFQAICINTIPILHSALTSILMHSDKIDPTYRMGYFSMNQTRKLVPLLQDDACLSVAPVVGMWIKFSLFADLAEQSLQSAFEDALQHPLTWAAAVRYLYSDRIQHRQFVADDTFLVVIFVGEHLRYYEFTFSLGRGRVVDTVPYPFLVMDFSVNLQHISERNVEDPKSEPLICKFKQVFDIDTVNTVLSNISDNKEPLPWKANNVAAIPFTRSTSEETSEIPIPRASIPTPAPSPLKPSTLSSCPDIYLPSPDKQMLEESSIMIAPGAYSSLHTAVKAGNTDSLRYQQLLSAPGVEAAVMTSMEMKYSFPAEVIATQQQQIEALREQVAGLQRLVEQLTLTNLHHSHPDLPVRDKSEISSEKSLQFPEQPSVRSQASSRPRFAMSEKNSQSSVVLMDDKLPSTLRSESVQDEEPIAVAKDVVMNIDAENGSQYGPKEFYEDLSAVGFGDEGDFNLNAEITDPVDMTTAEREEVSFLSDKSHIGNGFTRGKMSLKDVHEKRSIYESESILAIEAKYLNMSMHSVIGKKS